MESIRDYYKENQYQIIRTLLFLALYTGYTLNR